MRAIRLKHIRHAALFGAAVLVHPAQAQHWNGQSQNWQSQPTLPSRPTFQVLPPRPTPPPQPAPVQQQPAPAVQQQVRPAPAPPLPPPMPAPAPAPIQQQVQPAPPLPPAPAAVQAPVAVPAPDSAQAPARSAAENSALCANAENSAAPDTAIAACSSVIQDTVRNLALAHYLRGVGYRNKGEFDRALADFNHAATVDPAAEYINARGTAYEAKNDIDRAIADYDHALKLDPKFAEALTNRGAAHQKKNDFARAAQDYTEVTKLQPSNAEAWSARCWARAVLGRELPQALNDCNESLKLKPNAPDVLDSRGFIYLRLNQFDAAMNDYNDVLRLDPKYAPSLYGRGFAKLRKGDRSGTADIAAAKAIRPNIAEELARYGLR